MANLNLHKSSKFDFEKIDKPKFQERIVINYSLHPTTTRMTDYGFLSGNYYNSKLNETIIEKIEKASRSI